jgi:hypothetical protein
VVGLIMAKNENSAWTAVNLLGYVVYGPRAGEKKLNPIDRKKRVVSNSTDSGHDLKLKELLVIIPGELKNPSYSNGQATGSRGTSTPFSASSSAASCCQLRTHKYHASRADSISENRNSDRCFHLLVAWASVGVLTK